MEIKEAERQVFTAIDETGEEKEYEAIFRYDSEETGKSYIAYTDYSKDADGNIQVFASSYNPKEINGKLEPVETEKEWKIVEAILESLKQQQAENADKEEDEQ